MLKQAFRDFVFSTNTDGSGKAASYVRAHDDDVLRNLATYAGIVDEAPHN